MLTKKYNFSVVEGTSAFYYLDATFGNNAMAIMGSGLGASLAGCRFYGRVYGIK